MRAALAALLRHARANSGESRCRDPGIDLVDCRMKRREFIAGLGSIAAAWPLAARAQDRPPVIGFLSSRSRDEAAEQTAAFLRGLAAFGYVDGRSARLEYRWANGRYDRLSDMARELVSLHPAAIVAAGGTPAALAAKRATTTIPILFHTSEPVVDGIVASLNRPGGNVTGVDHMTSELGGKRVELLMQMVPAAKVIGFLTNTASARIEVAASDVRKAAGALHAQVRVVGGSSAAELETAFGRLVEQRADAVVVQNDASFDSRRGELLRLAAKHRLPAIYHIREYPVEGGLMSYGPSFTDTYFQLGIQTGRILKGANVAELPVVRSTRFELVLNLKTAKTLGLTVPPSLLALADEVIE